MKPQFNVFLLIGFFLFVELNLDAQSVNFTGSEFLGCPTDQSIKINIIPGSEIEMYYEYGTSSGNYTSQTVTSTAEAGEPYEIELTGLQSDTKYYYRMQYRTPGGSWVARNEHSFHTQRPTGSTFKFTIISDSHANYVAQYQQAISNVKEDEPDFHFDLGDTHMIDNTTSQSAVNTAYLKQRDTKYLGGVGSDIPVFFASGNHENEEGWNLDDAFSIAVASVKARKLFYPTPEPGGSFYTGNEDPLTDIDAATYGDQYREDYYAWTWGDALFIVFDPFQYTMQNPYGAMAGEGSDDPATGDRWNWTLGEEQFNWLKQTLENSNAKYKFMFAHHMLGGTQDYVRGGAVPAHMFEWGGNDADGTTWLFDSKRPTFGPYPIHQLMMDNGVSAFFHGHDHQYAYEVRDGIVYQSLPQPSINIPFNYYSESNEYTEKVFSSTAGHLCVTITPGQATVDYVRSDIDEISYTYTIEPNSTSPTYNLTMAVSPSGSGTTTPAAGVHSYEENTEVTISATRNIGYVFDHWTGEVGDPNSPTTTVTINSDKTVTAVFAATDIKLGDVNGDNVVNSTDALIILSCDAGLNTSSFCPMNPGDVNEDGLINSTDALIILSKDVGLTVDFPVAEAGYRSNVESCSGCDN